MESSTKPPKFLSILEEIEKESHREAEQTIQEEKNKLEYKNDIERFNEIEGKNADERCDLEDEQYQLSYDLLEKNTFETPMDRETAEAVITMNQNIFLDDIGGYPLWDEVSFKTNGKLYSIIAFGVSRIDEGKGALQGMVFVEEEE